MKIFGKYSTEEIKIEDPGLKAYINLDTKLMVKSHGRERERFGKAKINIVERLINRIAVPGHRGKKHKIITRVTGKFTQHAKTVMKTFDLIEEKTKQNPLQVLVKAIENAAPHDEITTIEYGGARYPQAVDCSPQRRVDLALRHLVHGAFDKSFNKKIKFYEALAQEIIAASQNSNESFAIRKKIEMEKQADSAR
ncbi:MAG: 30S ribosomal protein S7 [Candidatus Pacearchaeota archaeon]|nr:30S ribosomal protein S7 [Candidatus Pacearchaeota archaeon]